MCGRRFGKTMFGIEKACRLAMRGERVGWFAPTYKYGQEAWREISTRLRPGCTSISEQEKRLEMYSGGIVEVWTMDTADPARGRKYHLVIVDEAGLVRDLEHGWYGAIRPTLTDYRGKALFLGTPKGRTHAFSTLFAKGESGEVNWASLRLGSAGNPYLPADEVETARREMPPQVFAQEYEGIPSDDGGNPFGLDAIRECIAETVRSARDFEDAEGATAYKPVSYGWDFARAQDWTVGIGLNLDGDVTAFHRWQLVPWTETVRDVARHTAGVLSYGDSTGIGDAVVESCQRSGVPMVGVMFTPKEKQLLMQRLAVVIQERAIRFPAGVIASELESMGYEYTAHGVRYSAPSGLHDDCVMALALAVRGWDMLRISPRASLKVKPRDDIQGAYDYSAPNPAMPVREPLQRQLGNPRLIVRPPRGPGRQKGITLDTTRL